MKIKEQKVTVEFFDETNKRLCFETLGVSKSEHDKVRGIIFSSASSKGIVLPNEFSVSIVVKGVERK